MPGATEPLGEDDQISGAKLNALGGALDVGLHFAFDQIACLFCIECHWELPRRTAPPADRSPRINHEKACTYMRRNWKLIQELLCTSAIDQSRELEPGEVKQKKIWNDR